MAKSSVTIIDLMGGKAKSKPKKDELDELLEDIPEDDDEGSEEQLPEGLTKALEEYEAAEDSDAAAKAFAKAVKLCR